MTQTLQTNAQNDIFSDHTGNLVIATGIQGVLFGCASAAKAQLNEMIYAFDKGVANFQTIWRNSANVAQFEASLRATLLSVEGVTGIQELDIEVENGVCNYQATIQTIYGSGVVNG